MVMSEGLESRRATPRVSQQTAHLLTLGQCFWLQSVLPPTPVSLGLCECHLPLEGAEAEAQGGDDRGPSQVEPAAAAKPGVLALILGFLPLTSSHAWRTQWSDKASLFLDFLLFCRSLLNHVQICLLPAWNLHLESFNVKLLPLARTESPSWACEE
ncbi:hypothetical protein D623_10019116 [Myotis brandtii]|uniref:Uncharacterized protein n=1 Tax=Myotis brandtii TaxID=109478 RepID=S7PP76_MYOBR|nr:hypothetical protein D623_10019116 [Myotis brandtii]